MKNSLRVGIGLQIIFFILFFGAILPKMNNILGAIICLFISFLSLLIGVKSFKYQQKSIVSTLIITISVIILGFTIFAYFLGESGYPPLIMQ